MLKMISVVALILVCSSAAFAGGQYREFGAEYREGWSRRDAAPSRRETDLSPEDQAALNNLLAKRAPKVLGPQPFNSEGYIGEKPGHMPVPRGCSERKVQDPVTHSTFVRVDCGPGSRRRDEI